MELSKSWGEGYSLRKEGERGYVGTLGEKNKRYFVALDKPDPRFGRFIRIARKHLNGAPLGMKVVVELTAVDSAGEAYGKILEVLGNPENSSVAISGIIRSYKLREKFPPEVLEEVKNLPANPDPSEVEEEILRGRRDLRAQKCYTIDGLDARDLDDAIYVERLGEGYRLWVHIADVSHYVRTQSALDKEAFKRANSVYLVDRVLPMLPPQLSNGLCSLNPQQERLCLSCRLDFDQSGSVLEGEVLETVIISKLRSSYSELREVFADEAAQDLPEWFISSLETARELSQKLSQRRLERGALVFDFPETKIELNVEGKVLNIYGEKQDEANQIIESFMIAANEYVAEFCDAHCLPAIYRVHEDPEQEKLEAVIQYVRDMGINLQLSKNLEPKNLQRILESIKGEPYALTLSEMLLRSLAKARYDIEDLGHYGLASEQYCHFTAPIRRYADLMVHRALKAYLAGRHLQKKQRGLSQVADHISEMERVAIEAERDSNNQKIVEYYQDKLGESYEGQISGFSNFNMYVRLPNTVEGAIFYADMESGYIEYKPERMQAVNRDNGDIYELGDKVRVQIAKVDLERRFLDFRLLAHERNGERRHYQKTGGHGHSTKYQSKGWKKRKHQAKQTKGRRPQNAQGKQYKSRRKKRKRR